MKSTTQLQPQKEMAMRRESAVERKDEKKKEKADKIGSADVIDQLLDQQQTNGSWLYNRTTKTLLVSLSKIKEGDLAEL